MQHKYYYIQLITGLIVRSKTIFTSVDGYYNQDKVEVVSGIEVNAQCFTRDEFWCKEDHVIGGWEVTQ